MKKRALLSVYDKNGIGELASALAGLGWELVSTGGTAAYLRNAGFAVIDASELTGFPECLDGRVKTLHPAIHAGLLARRGEKAHTETLERLNIGTIDLVAVNLYPFFEKLGEGLPLDEMIEFIDIGGPSMLRSAAKNFRDVISLVDPADYAEVIEALKAGGGADDSFRRRLAGKVFNLTSAYDAAIAQYLLKDEKDADFPPYHAASLKKAANLRYGENAHQKACLYLRTDGLGAVAGMRQLGGAELGYNNYRDIDAAWKAACVFGVKGAPPAGSADVKRLAGFEENAPLAACAAVKHNTPCGAALGKSAAEAFAKARDCDPVSIFGGIAAFNTAVDEALAKMLAAVFLEAVIAPAYDEEALAILLKKPRLRVIQAASAPSCGTEAVSVDGGLLVQQVNRKLLDKWELVTKTPVDDADIPDLLFGARVAMFVKSNAIVVVQNLAAVGIGGGQTNRIWAAEHAISRAASRGFSPKVLASDAFFPFPDVAEAAAAAGIRAIIQSGGSANDGLSIEACDKHGIAMVFTGARAFKH